ncbi:ribonuclease-like isoform X1 [Pseudonaja textilis]|uniref:ribonuclease-like isoform X1 n=2 Tax=Pseudonaja textilis TaxID=8673 RepID=UPI000EA94595|nr:ribonuclease-like isoform X1 [Pseudonaja textilis]
MMFKGVGLGLFIVLAAVLMLGTFAADYETFLRQHYDNPKSNVGDNYCNKMMQRRGMTQPKCKEVNTFIHDTKNKIIAVCGDGGEAINNRLRRSKKQFRVTTCKMKGSSTKPPCDYRENESPRYIVIACENGLPVHYEEGQIYPKFYVNQQ